MTTASNKVLVLGANFCGNVGDLFILDTVCDFLRTHGYEQIDIMPYPRRNDRRIACLNYNASDISLLEPSVALRAPVERLMLAHRWIERLVTENYFATETRFLKLSISLFPVSDYAAVVALGGELHVPYSLLDTHSYLTKMQSAKLLYGPISVPHEESKATFLRQRFAEVSEVAVRDPMTYEWLQAKGIKNTRLVPDTAFLRYQPRASAALTGRIGLCLHSRWGYDPSLDSLVDTLVKAVESAGETLVFFATNLHEDYRVIAKYMQRYKSRPCVVFDLPESGAALARLTASFDLTISDRLHGLLVSLTQQTPILPLATRTKVQGYCRYLGIASPLQGRECLDELSRLMVSARSEKEATRQRWFTEQACEQVRSYFKERLA